MNVELVNWTDYPTRTIAQIGGISHDTDIKDLKDARDLVETLREDGHWSPFEFAGATFYIEEVSRSFLAQITRHRLASFMVESMRYVRVEPGATIKPDSVKNEMDEGVYDEAMQKSFDAYEQMVEDGIPKEDARMVLPIATETSMYFKANFRELRHIIELRGLNEHAQWEIREVAQKILTRMMDIAPTVFEDLNEKFEEGRY